MNLFSANGTINPDNETWAGSIQIDNKRTSGVKKNQMYHIEFDPNWEAYMVNIPFDSTISENKITDVQYKTNLNDTFRTYEGALTKNNNQMYRLDANAVELQEGEYFTEVKANVETFHLDIRIQKLRLPIVGTQLFRTEKLSQELHQFNIKVPFGMLMMRLKQNLLRHQLIVF